MDLPEDHPVAEALQIIGGERQESYGPPEMNFERIAKLWSVLFDIEITAEQVGWAMILLKAARQVHAPKRDNVVDAIGYAALLGDMEYRRTTN
jgi:hypothetical protein